MNRISVERWHQLITKTSTTE